MGKPWNKKPQLLIKLIKIKFKISKNVQEHANFASVNKIKMIFLFHPANVKAPALKYTSAAWNNGYQIKLPVNPPSLSNL